MIGLWAHARSNAVGYLALFVALGGTSYAAVSLPDGSVGNRQLRNHSITPVKLDRSAIGGPGQAHAGTAYVIVSRTWTPRASAIV